MIHYKIGDATYPTTPGPKVIAHVCNSKGGWGKGFVLALSKRWKEPEDAYRTWYRNESDPVAGEFQLGAVQLVKVGVGELYVANMIAQLGYGKDNSSKHKSSDPDSAIPLRYDALRECLEALNTYANAASATVHMPRIGCGLAGGHWERVEPLLACIDRDVYVYDLAT